MTAQLRRRHKDAADNYKTSETEIVTQSLEECLPADLESVTERSPIKPYGFGILIPPHSPNPLLNIEVNLSLEVYAKAGGSFSIVELVERSFLGYAAHFLPQRQHHPIVEADKLRPRRGGDLAHDTASELGLIKQNQMSLRTRV
jgi:hypothetical protein